MDLLWYEVYIRVYKFVRKIGRFLKGTRLQIAEEYLESQWISGLVRHYHAAAVRDIVKQFTDVSLSDTEVVQVVEHVRARHGWPPRSHESYFPVEDFKLVRNFANMLDNHWPSEDELQVEKMLWHRDEVDGL